MTFPQSLLSILTIIVGTAFTRFLPFMLFPKGKKTPEYVVYLGRVLPPAIFGLLMVYGFKDVSLSSGTYGLPELVATLFIILLQVIKRNMLLSIAGGTIVYMTLIQMFFV